MARALRVDPRLAELLSIVADEIDPLGVPYAIGGAIAMAAHGYARQTLDIDVFAPEESRPAILRALRRRGLQVSAIFEPHHYIALLPEHGDADIRIDVLVPAGEPDLSAAEYPERLTLTTDDRALNVVTPEFLAMQKFSSDREGDARDLRVMYDRGIFDPGAVRALLASFDDEGAAQWDALMARYRAPRPPKWSPPKGRRPKR